MSMSKVGAAGNKVPMKPVAFPKSRGARIQAINTLNKRILDTAKGETLTAAAQSLTNALNKIDLSARNVNAVNSIWTGIWDIGSNLGNFNPMAIASVIKGTGLMLCGLYEMMGRGQYGSTDGNAIIRSIAQAGAKVAEIKQGIKSSQNELGIMEEELDILTKEDGVLEAQKQNLDKAEKYLDGLWKANEALHKELDESYSDQVDLQKRLIELLKKRDESAKLVDELRASVTKLEEDRQKVKEDVSLALKELRENKEAVHGDLKDYLDGMNEDEEEIAKILTQGKESDEGIPDEEKKEMIRRLTSIAKTAVSIEENIWSSAYNELERMETASKNLEKALRNLSDMENGLGKVMEKLAELSALQRDVQSEQSEVIEEYHNLEKEKQDKEIEDLGGKLRASEEEATRLAREGKAKGSEIEKLEQEKAQIQEKQKLIEEKRTGQAVKLKENAEQALKNIGQCNEIMKKSLTRIGESIKILKSNLSEMMKTAIEAEKKLDSAIKRVTFAIKILVAISVVAATALAAPYVLTGGSVVVLLSLALGGTTLFISFIKDYAIHLDKFIPPAKDDSVEYLGDLDTHGYGFSLDTRHGCFFTQKRLSLKKGRDPGETIVDISLKRGGKGKPKIDNFSAIADLTNALQEKNIGPEEQIEILNAILDKKHIGIKGQYRKMIERSLKMAQAQLHEISKEDIEKELNAFKIALEEMKEGMIDD